MTIWKFPLEFADKITVAMPVGALVLCVQTQHGQPCIWALVDPSAPTEQRRFTWCLTGHPAPTPAQGRYVSTVQIHDGRLVFHLFEETLFEETR